MDHQTLALFFCLGASMIALLQVGLVLGAPWGEWAMGGQMPGKFSAKLRISALFQLMLILLSALIVLTRASLLFEDYFEWSQTAIWGVVILFAISSVLNWMTPSKKERLLGGPVATVMFITSLLLALSEY